MFSNWARLQTETREAGSKAGLLHLHLAATIARAQHAAGRFYIFEHPLKALSWDIDILKSIPGEMVRVDQCALGLTSPDGDFLQKPTIFKTNLPSLANELAHYTCPKNHKHGHIQGQIKGKKVSTWSQVYPRALCELVASHAKILGGIDP